MSLKQPEPVENGMKKGKHFAKKTYTELNLDNKKSIFDRNNQNSGVGYLSQVFILLFGLFLCGLITGCVLLSDKKFYEEPKVPNNVKTEVKNLGDIIKGKLNYSQMQHLRLFFKASFIRIWLYRHGLGVTLSFLINVLQIVRGYINYSIARMPRRKM